MDKAKPSTARMNRPLTQLINPQKMPVLKFDATKPTKTKGPAHPLPKSSLGVRGKNGPETPHTSSASEFKVPRPFTSQSSQSKLQHIAISSKASNLHIQAVEIATPKTTIKLKGRPEPLKTDHEADLFTIIHEDDFLVADENESFKDHSLIRHRNAYLEEELTSPTL